MDNESQQILQRYIQNDERLLWSGKPVGGILFRAFDAFLIPFFIFWTGFSLVWEGLAIWGGAPFFFPLFGIPFVVIGYHMLIGRFFQDAKFRAKTFYGITDKRIIIAYEGKTRKMKSWNLDKTEVSISRKKDGSGTLKFGKTDPNTSAGISMPFKDMEFIPELTGIQDVNRAYEILQKLSYYVPLF